MKDNIKPTKKMVIFGNSASGKSTLAKKLAKQYQLAHLDLDTLAWLPTISPPQRQKFTVSVAEINDFISQHSAWVIEGCYSDLLAHTLGQCSEVIFETYRLKTVLQTRKSAHGNLISIKPKRNKMRT
jgi:adenylate kinase family enzyme